MWFVGEFESDWEILLKERVLKWRLRKLNKGKDENIFELKGNNQIELFSC